MTDLILKAPPGPWTEFWDHFRRNKGAVLGLIIVLALSFVALFADFVAPYDPAEQFRDFVLLPPVWVEGGSWAYPLGTDDIGRDMLSRLIHGARLSLFIGLLVVTLSLVVGVALGLLAGFYGGASDTLIARFMDILLALPSLLLAIVVAAILGPGLVNAAIAVSVVIVPHYARLTRASVMAERGREYVTAARLAGASDTRLMLVT
ncbi:MAG: ABC transporter permease subunit, partial [Niveispirillum sp.]|nr:ABC transporter permease subunit [Niveispirillum sp.]